MKRRLIAFVGIFCIPVLIVSGAYAQKPDNPGKSQTEWIGFSGDLTGGQDVNGCCPNAGPFPPYRMCLAFAEGKPCYDGYLFINGYGAGKNRQYIVEFWTGETWPPGDNDVAIEIIGGVIDFDRTTKVLTVTFTDEPCFHIHTGQYIKHLTFTLVRRPS